MKKFIAAAAGLAGIGFLSVPAQAAVITDSWTFSGADLNNSGSGLFTYDDTTGLVSALTGTLNGNAVTFISLTDPAVTQYVGYSTYHGVPNSGGADFIFDDLYPQTLT